MGKEQEARRVARTKYGKKLTVIFEELANVSDQRAEGKMDSNSKGKLRG